MAWKEYQKPADKKYSKPLVCSVLLLVGLVPLMVGAYVLRMKNEDTDRFVRCGFVLCSSCSKKQNVSVMYVNVVTSIQVYKFVVPTMDRQLPQKLRCCLIRHVSKDDVVHEFTFPFGDHNSR